MRTLKLLLVDDESQNRLALKSTLEAEGYSVSDYGSPSQALSLTPLALREFDAAILDWNMPEQNGLDLGRLLRRKSTFLNLVMVTAYSNKGVRKAEAEDQEFVSFIVKPPEQALKKLLREKQHEWQSRREKLNKLRTPKDGILSESDAVERIREKIVLMSNDDIPVLITGESGTGKELLASRIHQLSKRASKPFIAINSAAIPESLIESELFGHERGAFTGATEQRLGRFELSNGGTLFLDEIGDMPLSTQVKILRALQEKTIQRVGGSQSISVDVRVIAATHKNLQLLVTKKTFREDLYYRLLGLHLKLPALRERTEDIKRLAEYFLNQEHPAMRFAESAIKRLLRHRWRGNIRELQNTVRSAAAFAAGLGLRVVSDSHIEFDTLGDPIESEQSAPAERQQKDLDACEPHSADPIRQAKKIEITAYLDALEKAAVAASQATGRLPLLSDVAQKLDGKNQRNITYYFTLERSVRGIEYAMRISLIKELAGEFPSRWVTLRKLKRTVVSQILR